MFYNNKGGNRILQPSRCKTSNKGNVYVELHDPHWVPNEEGYLNLTLAQN